MVLHLNGLSKFWGVLHSDAAAVFEALAQKVREKPEGGLHKRLFSFCKLRIELLSQLLDFIRSLPVNQITPVSVTLLQEAVASTQYREPARAIVQTWAENDSNKPLARVSKSKLKNFE